MTVLPQEHLGTLPSYRGLCVQHLLLSHNPYHNRHCTACYSIKYDLVLLWCHPLLVGSQADAPNFSA